MIGSRKDCRGGRACEPATLAEALHCLIEHSDLEVDQLAASLDRYGLHASRSYLYELANPARGDRGARGLQVASALTAITLRPVLLRFLCRVHGGEFVALPKAAAGGLDEVRVAADLLKDFAEAMRAFADGAADGHWSAAEVARFEREGHAVIERLLRAMAHARGCVIVPSRASKMARATRKLTPWLLDGDTAVNE